MELRPGDKRVVHHANVLLDRSGSARRRDARDPGPGFAGMDVELESDAFEPDSHFLFWKPGTAAVTEPDDMAWTIDERTDLVLNLHLQPTGKPERSVPSSASTSRPGAHASPDADPARARRRHRHPARREDSW
jgi:hypothetical protein